MRALKLWLAAGFGSGLLPFFPGTWGSLLALIPIGVILVSPYPVLLLIVFIAISCLINFWTAAAAEEHWGKDPAEMVIDEWAGQAVVFLGFSGAAIPIPLWMLLAAGFLFFRFFDILKPLGIKKIQNLNGGIGILSDDLLAGVYAFILLKFSLFIISALFG